MLHIAFLLQLALAPLSFGAETVELEDVVFVANRTSPQVAVIDAGKERVVGRVELSMVPSQIVALTQRRKLVSISSEGNVFGTADLYGVLPPSEVYLGFRPDYLQISPDEDLAAVAGTAANVVAIFAVGQPRELHRIANLPAPGYMVFDKTGARLFVSHRNSDRVTVIDARTGQVLRSIALEGKGGESSGGIAHLARTPGGELGFALHRTAARLSVFDLKTTEVVAEIALPGPAPRVFPTADSQYVLVPNQSDGSVSMISTWTLKESVRFRGTGAVTGINTALVETVALAINGAEEKAVLLDLRDDRQIGEFALPARPETGATAPGGLKVFVAFGDSDQVGIVDIAQGRLIKTIDGVGREPWAVFTAGGLSYCH